MKWPFSRWIGPKPAIGWLVAIVAVGALWTVLMVEAADAPAATILAGQPFPSLGAVKAVNQDARPNAEMLADLNLDQTGKGKYLLLFYWVSGHEISEQSIKEVAAWAAGKDNVVMVSVVPPRGRTPKQVAERASQLGLKVPVIWDEEFRIQAGLRASQVPHLTVIDENRVVRLVGGASLKHKVHGETTLVEYLETAVSGGGSPTIATVPRHYPVTELIDTRFFDFTLNKVPGQGVVRFSDHVTDGKLTLLVFWSADCRHCKIELPLLNDYYRKHKDSLNLVGVVRLKDDGIRKRTTDFLRLNDIQFPTVDDKAQKVWRQYRVVTTPTTVLVNPNGMVDGVMLGSGKNLDQVLGERITKIKQQVPAGA